MHVLEIIPLIAIPRHQSQLLTYFSASALSPGSLVEIQIRNKKTLGIVLSSMSLKNLKIMLRKEADFSIKSIYKIISPEPVLSPLQIRTALWLSSHYFAPLGLCVKTVLPPFFNKKKYPPIKYAPAPPPLDVKQIPDKGLKKIFIPTTNLENHYKDYEQLILSHPGKQILLAVPEIPFLDYFQKQYKHLAPEIVCSRTSPRKFYELHAKAVAGNPLFIIGTRVASFIPFSNLSLIIADNESNDSSRSDTTPRYDTGELLAYLAKEHGATLAINDLLPRPEAFFPVPLPSLSPAKFNPPFLISLVEEIKNKNFSIFSKELRQKILDTAEKKEKTILFIPRKGYASSLVCQGCSTTVQCENCSSSLVIHELAENKKILKCHHCQNEQSFIKVCKRCKNFMLVYRGLGIQKVRQKTKELFARDNKKEPLIMELSHDTAPREADEQKIIEAFRSSAPAILVCTQKIFSWLYLLKTDLMGIVNVDLCSAFPDFRAEEKTLRRLITLCQMATDTIIQGYNPDSPALKALLVNDLSGFLSRELETRKVFSYPPFVELIKLGLKHKSSTFFEEAKILAEKIKIEIRTKKLERAVRVIGPQTAFTAKEEGVYHWNIFLKMRGLETKKRNALLRLVPSRYWRVEINPKETL